ncbi:Hypothetical protein RADP37_01221a [Roseomonas mucosa]|uniref:Calcium-binding protein n=1 Tax=Roseomonas mucosa TaxID=207340 RepID=A0A4Y1N1B4_9PROT|nr:Hypothetical protein RADP37_01221a [Roseomonas mucosa]
MAIYYGDTSGVLSGFQHASAQVLVGDHVNGTWQSVTNRLYGDAYSITSFAHGGDDTLVGGYADLLDEIIYGDAYVMDRFSVGGNDMILGGGSGSHARPTIYGDAYEMHGFSRGGNDQIIGNSATVYGDSAKLDGFTIGGNDEIEGGVRYGSIVGDGALSGFAKGGDDRITVTSGVSEVYISGDGALSGFARGGNDLIIGGNNSGYQIISGDGSLSGFARGGDDIIIAGSNSYNLISGDGSKSGQAVGGSDTFVFNPGITQNRILDFEQGKDHIDLTGFASQGVHGLGDLTIHTGSVALGNGQTIQGSSIHFGTYNYIAVLGVEHLTSCDFIFA